MSKRKNDEPDWLNPANDRKTPYTDKKIKMFVDDFIANMRDVRVWKDLIKEVGERKARQILVERFMARDTKNLFNWELDGSAN